MPDDQWIIVPNWEKFQHYKDRQPAWIKLYVELLDKDEYLRLSPVACALLTRVWLLYARKKGGVSRTDLAPYATRLKARSSHWQELEMQGFIRFSASKPLAKPYQSASTEKKEEVLRTSSSKRGASTGPPKPGPVQRPQNDKDERHQELLEAATRIAQKWNGLDSDAFEESLDSLEQDHMARLGNLERSLLWDLAFQPDKTNHNA